MLEDLKNLIQEIKPELMAFLMASIMALLHAIAEPEESQTKLGVCAQVLMTAFLAVGVASIVRALHMDPNFATFIGTAVGVVGYKASRNILISILKGKLK